MFICIFQKIIGNTPNEVNRVKVGKPLFLFACGGAGYLGLELLWRGWTHPAMFFAGGTCFLLLGRLDRWNAAPAWKALTGAGVITGVELLAGLLVNRRYQIWDYRGMPYNFLGQICLLYTLLWIPVSLGAILLHRWLAKKAS